MAAAGRADGASPGVAAGPRQCLVLAGTPAERAAQALPRLSAVNEARLAGWPSHLYLRARQAAQTAGGSRGSRRRPRCAGQALPPSGPALSPVARPAAFGQDSAPNLPPASAPSQKTAKQTTRALKIAAQTRTRIQNLFSLLMFTKCLLFIFVYPALPLTPRREFLGFASVRSVELCPVTGQSLAS